MEPSRLALDAFIDTTQRRVSGTVTVKFYKGSMRVVGRKSENSLYQHKLSTYDRSSTFDQASAVGFIELWGLPSIVANEKLQVKRKKSQVAMVSSSRSRMKSP